MSPPNPYVGEWADWSDVQAAFRMEEREPTQVLLADYSYEDYSGYGRVVFRRGRHYYEVSGSHCSCHGLEDQWEPEGPMTKTVLKGLISRGAFGKTNGDVILTGLGR